MVKKTAVLDLTAAPKVKIYWIATQNTELKTNVEEKETVVIQNTEELNNLKNERENLEIGVSRSGEIAPS